MLTKRTNILFHEEEWRRLVALAKQYNRSVGELVRVAVEEKYFSALKSQEIQNAYRRILHLRRTTEGHIDYKALINEDRRF